LPGVEMAALYDRVTFGGSFYLPNHANNRTAFDGVKVPSFICPSDPMEPMNGVTVSGAVVSTVLKGSYVAIRGANDHPSTDHMAQRGPVSRGGVFFHNSRIGMRDITDGTSNTMLIGEQSNFVTFGADRAYNVRTTDGLWMGHYQTPEANGNSTYAQSG